MKLLNRYDQTCCKRAQVLPGEIIETTKGKQRAPVYLMMKRSSLTRAKLLFKRLITEMLRIFLEKQFTILEPFNFKIYIPTSVFCIENLELHNEKLSRNGGQSKHYVLHSNKCPALTHNCVQFCNVHPR